MLEINMMALAVANRKRKHAEAPHPIVKRKCGRPPSVVFDAAHEMFLKVYNRPGYSELQSRDDSKLYWDAQADVKPSERHLMYRKIGTDKWKRTGVYYSCKKGLTKNRTPAEAAQSHRDAALRTPPELRQTHFLEERAIQAMIMALSEYCDQNRLPKLEWLFVPDGLKNADVLCRLPRAPPGLYIALQFKSATHKDTGSIMFAGTDSYSVPMLCVTLKGYEIQEVLLFREAINLTSVSIVHGKPSENPVVQAARRTTIAQVYAFLAEFPVANMKTRDYWVFDKFQSAYKRWLGLLVEKFVEDLMGQWVQSPSGQNKAVDGFVGQTAVSFKTATRPHKMHFAFKLGSADDHDAVDVFIVGFRDGERVVSLGVLPVSAVDWTKTQYSWNFTDPFKGTAGITTLEQLRAALEKHRRR